MDVLIWTILGFVTISVVLGIATSYILFKAPEDKRKKQFDEYDNY